MNLNVHNAALQFKSGKHFINYFREVCCFLWQRKLFTMSAKADQAHFSMLVIDAIKTLSLIIFWTWGLPKIPALSSFSLSSGNALHRCLKQSFYLSKAFTYCRVRNAIYFLTLVVYWWCFLTNLQCFFLLSLAVIFVSSVSLWYNCPIKQTKHEYLVLPHLLSQQKIYYFKVHKNDDSHA